VILIYIIEKNLHKAIETRIRIEKRNGISSERKQ
jgi:hypothetical protein